MKKTIDFLKKIKKNNNKEWFDKNRPVYEEAKAEFTETIQDVLTKVSKFDKSISGLDAKKTLFRINKDVRFSKNKDPYKTNFGSNMSPGGKKSLLAGYYLHMEPGKCFLAGGCYMPEPAQLAAIRQEIDYNLKDFKKIIGQKDFKKYFGGLSDEEKLVNPPKGYDKENPAVEYIKYKHFIAYHEVPEKIYMSPKFPQYAADVFKAMYPFIVFLRNAG